MYASPFCLLLYWKNSPYFFYWENMVGMMEQLWLYVDSEVHESAFWAMIFAFSQK